MDAIHTEVYKKHTIAVYYDECPESPREWGTLTKMFCFHKRMNVGDKHTYKHNEFSGWDEFEAAIRNDYDVVMLKPVFMYSHSGDTIRTTPFSCPWDSGQVGFVFITKHDMLKEFKRELTKEELDKIIEGEVKSYDEYIRGEVYVLRIEDPDGEMCETYGGCFGDWKELVNEAKREVDGYVKQQEEQYVKDTSVPMTP